MKRRNLLIGMGSVAAGGAATIGTGAFTSVTAERSVDVAVAGDQSAYLALEKVSSSPNTEYLDTSGDTVSFALDGTDEGGQGFNPNAITRIDDLVKVTNQGTQSIYFWVNIEGVVATDGDIPGSNKEDDFVIVEAVDPDDGEVVSEQVATDDDSSNWNYNPAGFPNTNKYSSLRAGAVEIPVGKSANLNLVFASNTPDTFGDTIEFNADANSTPFDNGQGQV